VTAHVLSTWMLNYLLRDCKIRVDKDAKWIHAVSDSRSEHCSGAMSGAVRKVKGRSAQNVITRTLLAAGD